MLNLNILQCVIFYILHLVSSVRVLADKVFIVICRKYPIATYAIKINEIFFQILVCHVHFV